MSLTKPQMEKSYSYNHLRLLAHFYILDFLVLACLLILVFFIFDIDTAKMRRAIKSNKSQGTHGKIVGNL